MGLHVFLNVSIDATRRSLRVYREMKDILIEILPRSRYFLSNVDSVYENRVNIKNGGLATILKFRQNHFSPQGTVHEKFAFLD